MSRCSICSHPNREAIDKALLARVPNRRASTQFGVTESAIRRHKPHVAERLKLAAASVTLEKATQGRTLATLLDDSHQRLNRIIRRNMKGREDETAIKALKERRELAALEFGAPKQKMEFSGEFDASGLSEEERDVIFALAAKAKKG